MGLGASGKALAAILGFSLAAAGLAYFQWDDAQGDAAAACFSGTAPRDVWVPGGRFTMGDPSGYPEEGPPRQVQVEGFWFDAHEVTNAQFAEFVRATAYVTVAERRPDPAQFPGIPRDRLVPGSAVFSAPDALSSGNPSWRFVPGASWRHPTGPGSSIDGFERYPVVQVAYEDALAYARWAGRSLPTEAQWEFAARGGLEGRRYAWGDEFKSQNGHSANTWQGAFPVYNSAEDGYPALAPAGCFPPNGYGLYDMIGNVWEWTSTAYFPTHAVPADAPRAGHDPREPGLPVQVIKGGSFLCAPNYCARFRPAARQPGDVTLGSSHIGFRTARMPPG